MTIASILLGVVIASILGFAFHFWRGGELRWLLLYLLLSWIGFWAGHLLALVLKVNFLKLGPINLGFALIGSLLFLFGGYWLSMAGLQPGKKNSKYSENRRAR
jgi:hypothetical protein